MIKYFRLILVFFVFSSLVMCKQDNEERSETILEGKTSILVDETLLPIVEEQVAVFESDYKADITLIPRSEAEAVQAFLRDSSKIIILARDLTPAELQAFEKRKIIPERASFATDAIALLSNKKNTDTLINIADIISFMQGRTSTRFKGLVFDNPNSSTVRFIKALAGVNDIPATGVYSFKTNEEVIEFVAENEGMIGVVGLNWIYEPSADVEKALASINVLSVKGYNEAQYYFPSQENLAAGVYPLARDLFIVNAQGYSGLGMGFGSFIAGDRGQRIILKAGLLPKRLPGRNINIRTKIEK
ncbi:MAG TPA: substrate-binding domain-containing protein [Flavobacterium sp.]|nr:substrate-binding domain-containing protein [Flavobacterium sp.]